MGGWLMMEGYILGGRNIAEQQFKADFNERFGKAARGLFEKLFRSTFIQEKDFKNLSGMQANCVRLPFNARLVENNPAGFTCLDKAFPWGV